MDRKRQRMFGGVSIAGVALVLASALAPLTQRVAAQATVVHGQASRAAAPAFVFGTKGGNIVPLSIAIGADGAVTIQRLGKAVVTSLHLTQDTLSGLRTLAVAERFTALPSRMIRLGNPDVSGQFISMNTGTGMKTVHVRFVRSPAFDQLYAVLMAVTAPAMPGPHPA